MYIFKFTVSESLNFEEKNIVISFVSLKKYNYLKKMNIE